MDSYLLGNGGTTVDIGTWLRADPGPEFGGQDLLKAVYAENPRVEGGRLAFEQAGVRRMSFPLVLASGGAGLPLTGLEELLRELARPGGTLDVKADGVATADAVRFDILTGRYEPDYQIRHQEYDRRLGTLRLDVSPYGYSPTWLILASAASVGLPGSLDLATTLLGGDAPGLVVLTVQPSSPAVTTTAGSWMVDMVAWALGARASFQPVLGGGSWVSALPSGAYQARSESVTGTVLTWMLASDHSGWTQIAYYDIPSALEPAYRGRFRAYGYARQALSLKGDHVTKLLALDAAVLNPSAPLASAGMVATLGAQPASVFAPQVIDLGEVALPPVASGVPRTVRLRLWGYGATPVGTTQTFGDLSAVCLVPADSPAGVLPRGLAWPFDSPPTAGRLSVDGGERQAEIAVATGTLASGLPVADALRWYRGGMPRVQPSVVSLSLAGGARRTRPERYREAVLADSPLLYFRVDDTAGSPTMTDSSRNEVHGAWVNTPSLGQPGLIGGGSQLAGWFDGVGEYGYTTKGGGGVGAGTAYTLEFWTRRQNRGIGTQQDHAVGQGSPVAGRGVFARYFDNAFQFGVYSLWTLAVTNTPDWEQPHHWVCRHHGASKVADVHKDGVLVASDGNASAYLYAALPWFVGAVPSLGLGGTLGLSGGLDEVAIYQGQLATTRILAHYQAGAADDTLARPAPAHAAVSVLYRPRFQFLKGGV